MPDTYPSIEPATPIGEAIVACPSAREFEGFGFVQDDTQYVLLPQDLQKMAAMGLETIPVEAIAVPHGSPILHTRHMEVNNTLDLSHRLTRYFPGHMVAALYELQSLVKKGGFKAYLIGGNVRDILLYKERKLELPDVDITLEGDAIGASHFMVANSRNFKIDEVYPEFGTVKIYYKDTIEFDLATTRKETYDHCGAMPEVLARGVPLAEDIVRRDFTANSLAMSIHDLGLILDHTHGIEDVENRLIRVLHPVSFFEDPSRILRALKFLARLDFELTTGTRRLLEQFIRHAPSVYHGGGERIREEMIELLGGEESPTKHRWVQFFVTSNTLSLANTAIPSGSIQDSQKSKIATLWGNYPLLREAMGLASTDDRLWKVYLCYLLCEMPEPLFADTVHRLGLNRSVREGFEKYRRWKDKNNVGGIEEYSSPAEVDEIFHDKPWTTAVCLLLDAFSEDPVRLKTGLLAFKTYKEKYEMLRPELNGNDLIDLGLPEGEAMGKVLKKLRHAKLSGRLPDRMAEIKLVKELLAELKPDEPKSVSEETR